MRTCCARPAMVQTSTASTCALWRRISSMQDINTLKQQQITETPLFLFECVLPSSGTVERWSTHNVTVDGVMYRARVLSHNLFELKASLDDGADGAARIALVLANADSYFSEIEWNEGFKGAQLTVRFAFFDL